MANNSTGTISAVRWIVIDIHFTGTLPAIYEAVTVETPNSNGDTVVVEILQQLQWWIVRWIAMNTTDGLQRGYKVTASGSPITVPVGPQVLGHIFDVLGNTIDGTAPVKWEDSWPIHRDAPDFEDLSTQAETLVTWIKVVDLLAPVLKW